MDPRLMKLFGSVVQTPAEGTDGEDGADHHEAEGGDGDDGDGEDPEDGEDGEDGGEEDEGDGDDDGDGDDEDEEEDDEGLGKRAQKRINKLIAKEKDAQARVRTLERELEAAKKLSGDDGKAILRAAETSGILPGLMSRDEAEGFLALERYPKVIESYQEWLDDHSQGDEFEAGENTMTYGQVKRRVRQLAAELEKYKDDYGERRKALKKKVREIFEAGIEALKNGHGAAKTKKTPDEEKKRKVKKLEQKPRANSPKPKHAKSGGLEDFDVDNEEDLEEYIAAMRREEED